MPFHIYSSTFKIHGDPLFRKIGKVPSSKSHAEAHSSDCLPAKLFPSQKLFPLGSVLCVVHDWKESLGRFSPVISFSCISCSPSILRQLFLLSSVLVLLSFTLLFSIHGFHPAISPFLHAFCSCPIPSYLSPFSSATFICFLFSCPFSCNWLLRAMKPAATSCVWLGNLKW